jgi:hypothetical protein
MTKPITMNLHKYSSDIIEHKHHRGTAMYSLSWRDVCYCLIGDNKPENIENIEKFKIEISKVTEIRNKKDD